MLFVPSFVYTTVPPPPVANKVDYTARLPRDLKQLIASWLTDPLDMIALAVTNRAWRVGASSVCQRKIEAVFGTQFMGNRDPVAVAAEIWAPLWPKTRRLAKIFEQHSDNPISDEMRVVLHAIEAGTLEELRAAVAALKDLSELTKLKFGIRKQGISRLCHLEATPANPLRWAIPRGGVETVRYLIDMGTPIGVGVGGVFAYLEAPLACAATFREADILKLLLENGASLSAQQMCYIYQTHVTVPDKLIYVILNGMVQDPGGYASFRCAALAMRYWRYEVGMEAIQKDERLAKIAGIFSIQENGLNIAKLLMSYGVVPDVRDQNMYEIVIACIRRGKRDHLEFFNKQGWLDYDGFFAFTLRPVDIAIMFGQFELEDFLVQEKKLFANDLAGSLASLAEKVLNAVSYNILPRSHFHLHQFFTDDWKRLMEIIDHYKLNVESLYPTVCHVAAGLRYDTLPCLKMVEDLVRRGVQLDGAPSLRELLQQKRSEYNGHSDVTQKIDSILKAEKVF